VLRSVPNKFQYLQLLLLPQTHLEEPSPAVDGRLVCWYWEKSCFGALDGRLDFGNSSSSKLPTIAASACAMTEAGTVVSGASLAVFSVGLDAMTDSSQCDLGDA
jgi:hypothetical protein